MTTLNAEARVERPKVMVSSDEINILIYAYLLESRFEHAAYTLRSEAHLESSPLFSSVSLSASIPGSPVASTAMTKGGMNGHSTSSGGGGKDKSKEKDGGMEMVPRGQLVALLQSGLIYMEIKAHVTNKSCPHPFQLLTPHQCLPPTGLALTSSRSSDRSEFSMEWDEGRYGTRHRTDAGARRKRAGEAFGVGWVDGDVEMDDVYVPRTEKKKPVRGARDSPGSDNERYSTRKQHPKDDPKHLQPSTSPNALAGPSRGPGPRGPGRPKNPDTLDAPKSRKRRLSDISREQGNGRPGSAGSGSGKMRRIEEDVPGAGKGKAGGKGKRRKSDEEVGRLEELEEVEEEEEGEEGVLRPEKNEEGVVVWRGVHGKQVLHIVWNPQQPNKLASCGADNTCYLWEFEDPSSTTPTREAGAGGSQDLVKLVDDPKKLLHRGIESRKSVSDLCWNPEGTLLATISEDGIARTFLDPGELFAINTRHVGAVHTVAFNTQGNHYATAGHDGSVVIWQTASQHSAFVRSIPAHQQEVFHLEWLDNEIFASCSADGTVAICNALLAMPVIVLKGHKDRVMMVKFSPPVQKKGGDGEFGKEDRRLLASASEDKSIRIWDLFDEKGKIGILQNSGGLNGMGRHLPVTPLHPPSRAGRVSSSSEGGGSEKDHGKGSKGKGKSNGSGGSGGSGSEERVEVEPYLRKKLMGHEDDVMFVQWSPRGLQEDGKRLLASASCADNNSKSKYGYVIKMWDVEAGKCLYTLTDHTAVINAIEFSPDGKLFVSCSDDELLIVWDAETGKKVKQYDAGAGINDVKWRPDGKQLAMALHDQSMRTMFVGDLLK